MIFKWYETITDKKDLQQGDFIPDCPIIIPPSKIEEGDEPEIDIKLIDSIVLSQSCDLIYEKIELVLVCPYYSLKTFLECLPKDQQSQKSIEKTIENLRKGYLPSYHLLNNSKEIENLKDYQVVDFRNVYGIQFSLLFDIIRDVSNRVRLLPPYREHLSQSFARYFMRVGLPQDIEIEGY